MLLVPLLRVEFHSLGLGLSVSPLVALLSVELGHHLRITHTHRRGVILLKLPIVIELPVVSFFLQFISLGTLLGSFWKVQVFQVRAFEFRTDKNLVSSAEARVTNSNNYPIVRDSGSKGSADESR